MDVINAVQKTKSDPEAARKRQELNQRIAETKKKLESVSILVPHSIPPNPRQNKRKTVSV